MRPFKAHTKQYNKTKQNTKQYNKIAKIQQNSKTSKIV